jgi:ATP-dependent Clp protease ATP-binding subunit ClpB
MSEFMEKHSVARLIGAPPGYVGYVEGGYLTEAVRRKPYSVILMDEIEKAHSDVFNILLQVLDDGRLTDGQGRTVDFKNTLIIMTSNIGSSIIQENTGNEYEVMKEQVMAEVSQHFKPEFINRLDESVVFHSLKQDEIEKIADIQLNILKKRLLEQDISLTVTPSALSLIGKVGFDPVFGARPLKRIIQQYVENPLAQKILANEFIKGSSVVLDMKEEELSLKTTG